MLESSLCNSNGTNSQKNLIKNFVPDEIDANSNQEFQNLVNQMILNLVAKTEAELMTISTITQKYKEIAPQKN
ncbi:MAG: hypothetical protein AB4206_10745 [Xenococcaceae cyanobacterium]